MKPIYNFTSELFVSLICQLQVVDKYIYISIYIDIYKCMNNKIF